MFARNWVGVTVFTESRPSVIFNEYVHNIVKEDDYQLGQLGQLGQVL